MNKKVILFTIFFTALFAVSSLNTAIVFAAVDGTAGSADMYDSAAIIGTLTKDITDTSNIFVGTYGDGLSYSLSDFNLKSGEIYDSSSSSDDANGFGNVSFNPAFAIHDYYNSTGLLNKADYTETDSSSLLTVQTDTVASKVGAPPSLRLYFSGTDTTAKADITYELTSGISTDQYFLFGAYINSETLNISTSMMLAFLDAAGNSFRFYLSEDATDWSVGSASDKETISFDDDAGDTILICLKLSDFDSYQSAVTISSITKVSFSFNAYSSAFSGAISVDIFALDFIDSVAKAGIDRGDELTSESDYVALNITDPSSPTLKVREIDSHISKILDADIDFIYTPNPTSEIYDDSDFSVTRKWEIMIDTKTDWIDEVSFSNMKLYYVLGASNSKYSKFQYAGQEKSSLLLNEEAGDAILLSDSIEIDTVYLLEVTRTYTADEFDDMISGASLGFFESAISWVREKLAVFFGAIGLTAISAYLYKKNRSTKARAKSRK